MLYRKPFFFPACPFLFGVVFCRRHLFVWLYLVNQQQINGRRKQNSARLNRLAGLFTRGWINVQLLCRYTEDQRNQMAFSGVLLTFYSSVILRINPAWLSVLPVLHHCWCCCCFSGNEPFLPFWLANVSVHLQVISPPCSCRRMRTFILKMPLMSTVFFLLFL